MPVAHLVNLFESMDHPSTSSNRPKMRRTSKASNSSSRGLTLRTMFRSHSRVSSSSSTTETIASSTGTGSPTFDNHAFEFASTTSTDTSPQSGPRSDPFAIFSQPSDTCHARNEQSGRPIRIQRSISFTSLALQSEYEVDRIESSGINLFEPRPHTLIHQGRGTIEPVVMDSIMEVIKSG